MKRYTMRVKHDRGFVTIRTVASSVEAARMMVCRAELCPDRAIRRVYVGQIVGAKKAQMHV